jgi:hypothetical protein
VPDLTDQILKGLMLILHNLKLPSDLPKAGDKMDSTIRWHKNKVADPRARSFET